MKKSYLKTVNLKYLKNGEALRMFLESEKWSKRDTIWSEMNQRFQCVVETQNRHINLFFLEHMAMQLLLTILNFFF